MMHRRSLLLVCLLAGNLLHAAPKEQPLLPPPMAQGRALTILRGRTVDIPLRAQGRTPGQLKFFIRSYPAHGWLGEIRAAGSKAAVVTYSHDGTAEESDSFTFAVQAVDSPVSAAAPINITIFEEAPALSVVQSLAFGAVLLGETREEQVTLRNSGGGVLDGQMDVTRPWKVLGSTEYRLGRNQEQNVRIVFAPEREQGHSGKLTFSHDPGSFIELSGTGFSPFEFDPAREVELVTHPGTTVRSGHLVIRNCTARDRTFEVAVPAQIAPLDQVTVLAGGEKKIVFQTRSDFLGALEGVAVFQSEEFRDSIALRVFAFPPILRIEPREGLAFGEIERSRRYKGVLRVKNDGGSVARLRTTTAREIVLAPDPSTTMLAPGESRLFEVGLEPSSIGDYRSEIIIDVEAGEAASMAISARVVAQAGEARKIPTSRLNPSAEPAPTTGSDSEQSSSSVSPVTEIQVGRASNRVFEIGWSKPSADPLAWAIQQGQFDMENSGSPRLVWRDLRKVKFLEQDGRVIGRFENLAPGQVWLLRIISIDKEGRRSAPSPIIRLSSAMPKPSSPFWWVASLLALGILAFGASKLRARREAEASHHLERIAQMESR